MSVDSRPAVPVNSSPSEFFVLGAAALSKSDLFILQTPVPIPLEIDGFNFYSFLIVFIYNDKNRYETKKLDRW